MKNKLFTVIFGLILLIGGFVWGMAAEKYLNEHTVVKEHAIVSSEHLMAFCKRWLNQ
jgi:hypothetical protein